MSAPEVRDGLLEAFQRRERLAIRAAAITMVVGLVPILSVIGWLCWELRHLQSLEFDNARLRTECGLQEHP
jgi:hypothetical protein